MGTKIHPIGSTSIPDLWELELLVADVTSQRQGIPRERIQAGSRLVEDLNIDSLDYVELIMELEETFDVSLPDDLGKQMFIRSPMTISVLAECVRHQWGTGMPQRNHWIQPRQVVVQPPRLTFTQLGGVPEAPSGPLYEPLAPLVPGVAHVRRRTDGMRGVVIPAAEVELGSPDGTGGEDEHPSRRVSMGAFVMDVEPVSVTAFARFLNFTARSDFRLAREWGGVDADDHRQIHFQLQHQDDRWEPRPGTAQQPVVLVSWYGAAAYSRWANGRDWRNFRSDGFLPTEAQWEYAARGASHCSYPWGEEPATADRARVGLHRVRQNYTLLPLAEVQTPLGLSPFGLNHMAGNVWQWCADWYASDFYGQPEARQPNPCNHRPTGIRVERGGSWVGPGELARSSYRRGRPPAAVGRCLGFRCLGCVEDLPSSTSRTLP